MSENSAAAPSATEPEGYDAIAAWKLRYHRALLTSLKVDPDTVEMDSVTSTASWDTAWSYSEYNNGDAEFSLFVTWRSRTPRWSANETPDWDGLYPYSQKLTNEDVAAFLNTVTGP